MMKPITNKTRVATLTLTNQTSILIRALIATALVLLALPLMPVRAQQQTCPFEMGMGLNYPWHKYGIDFGVSGWGHSGVSTARAAVEAEFAYMRDHNVKVIRWFLFGDGRAAPNFNANGSITLEPEFWADMDAALEIAEAHDIQIIFVLFDVRIADKTTRLGGINVGGHQDVVENPTVRQAFLDGTLKPLLQRYGNHPSIYGWEVMNEPEGALPLIGGWWWDHYLSVADMQAFHADVVDYIHSYSSQRAILGSETHTLMSTAVKEQGWIEPATFIWKDIPFDVWSYHNYGTPLDKPVSELQMGGPVFVGEFPTVGLNISQQLDLYARNGYASAFPWSLVADDSYSDFRAVADQYRDWAEANGCDGSAAPQPTATFTPTAVPPTATSVPPTATSVPPTATPLPTVDPATLRPAPVSPASDASTGPLPTLSWETVAGYTTYRVQLSSGAFGTPAERLLVDKHVGSSGSSYALTKPLAAGTYYWRVGTWLGESYAYAEPRSFTTSGVLLTSPAYDASVSPMPGLAWQALDGFNYYTVQVDNNGDFASPEVDKQVAFASQYTTPALSAGMHYWRVGVWDGGAVQYGQPSRFFVGVTLTGPADGTTVSLQPTLEWQTAPQFAYYVVEIDDNSDMGSPLLSDVEQRTEPVAQYDVKLPLSHGTFYWRVGMWTGAEYVYSATRRIDSTGVALVSPDASADTHLKPTIAWASVPGFRYNLVQLDDDPDMSSPFLEDWEVDRSSYTVPGLLPQGPTYWRIGMWTGSTVVYSAVRTLHADIHLLSPDDADAAPATPTLAWLTTPGYVYYIVEIDDDAGFGSPVLADPEYRSDSIASYAVPHSLSDGRWYWRVGMWVGDHYIYSASQSFTVP